MDMKNDLLKTYGTFTQEKRIDVLHLLKDKYFSAIKL
uniref:Uncharacterized protein n=1 Tax=Lepeophtheirus salmonis TaxID=72036 RepID=A0A0K2U0W4_LEPSM